MRIYCRSIAIILMSGAISLAGSVLAWETVTTAASDAIPGSDGPLPIYPGVRLPDEYPANFWTSGLYRQIRSIELYSPDDPATVEAWYRARLAGYTRKTYSRNGFNVTTFEAPGALVKVSTTAGTELARYGKTFILLHTDN